MTHVMPSFRCAAAVALCVFAASAVALPAHKPTDAEKKFKKLLADRIGRIWYASMDAHKKQLVPGATRIGVAISPERKILELRLVSNTSKEAHERRSLRRVILSALISFGAMVVYFWLLSSEPSSRVLRQVYESKATGFAFLILWSVFPVVFAQAVLRTRSRPASTIADSR
jgi:hypothetical protein